MYSTRSSFIAAGETGAIMGGVGKHAKGGGLLLISAVVASPLLVAMFLLRGMRLRVFWVCGGGVTMEEEGWRRMCAYAAAARERTPREEISEPTWGPPVKGEISRKGYSGDDAPLVADMAINREDAYATQGWSIMWVVASVTVLFVLVLVAAAGEE